MGFDSGAIAYTRFAVAGEAPKVVDDNLLDQFRKEALTDDQLGAFVDTAYGWCGGRHVLDEEFHVGHNVYADSVIAGLRVDTNQVPAEIKRAYKLMEEQAAAKNNPSGFISKQQKRLAKDSASKRIEDDLQSGKFRRSKMTAMLWDAFNSTVYSGGSVKQREQLAELFERSLSLKLIPLSSGSLAMRMLEDSGKRRDYEDMNPTRFAIGPGGDAQPAEYPWTAKGEAGKDWLGSEFLVWLWHEVGSQGGALDTEEGSVNIMFTQVLDLDCVFGATGRDVLRNEGPCSMIEAMEALRTGKVPRRAGLVLEHAGSIFQFSLDAASLGVSGLKLPDVEEADSPRVVFEERIGMMRLFQKLLDSSYMEFLKVRASTQWEQKANTIRHWIGRSLKAKAA
jgi:hypothetical protein